MIGVDRYLDSPGFPCLAGAVRDATHMERLLRRRFGVAQADINCLLASPEVPLELQPTHHNLVLACERLVAGAVVGQQILIHYSGHGARVPTALPDLKGAGALDECLVPCDIGRDSARYIRDLEIAALLDRLSAKGAFVTLVLDACHSGGATRGPAKARGLAQSLTVSKPSDTPLASAEAIRRAYQRRQARAKSVQPEKGWVPVPEGYVCLAACRAAELAYEYPFDGHFSGALSHWLFAALEGANGESVRQILERVTRRVRAQFEMQHPQLEGEADRAFLGLETLGEVPIGVPVLEIDDRRRIRIAVGVAMGVGLGARLRFEPAGLTARVVEADAVASWAEADTIDRNESTIDRLTVESRARVLEPGRCGRLRLGVDSESGLAGGLMTEIEAAIERWGGGSVVWVGAREAPDLLVAAIDSVFELRDAAGVALSLQEPRLVIESVSVPRLVQRLVHLARFANVRQLENPDPVAYLRDALQVEIGRLADDYRAKERPRPDPATLGGSHLADVGQWLCLRLLNTSTLVLNIAVLDLQPDWGISQVFPTATAAPCFELEPGSEQLLPLRADLPAGCDRGRDVLTVLAAIDTTDFRCLELPPLVQVGSQRIVRPFAAQSGLEGYLASLTDRHILKTRSVGAVAPRDPHAGRDWITAQVAVDIRRPGIGH